MATPSGPALCVLQKLVPTWSQLTPSQQAAVYASSQTQVENPLLQVQLGCASEASVAAGAAAGTVLPWVVAQTAGFVFSTIGHFLTNFGTTLLAGLGKVNEGYIVGLLVAAVVVFILLGGQ